MQPSLTFLHLDANINLQTILTDKKRNNLVSKRNKIKLIDFRTFYFVPCKEIHPIQIYDDERSYQIFHRYFSRNYLDQSINGTADRLLLSTTFHVSLTGFYPLSCATLYRELRESIAASCWPIAPTNQS